MRSHDQYNSTLYSNSDRYRGVFNQRMVLFLDPAEIARLGLTAGALVTVETVSLDGVERRLTDFTLVAHSLPAGCCGAYYPEANPLLPLYAHDAQSGTPAAKAIPVRISCQEAG